MTNLKPKLFLSIIILSALISFTPKPEGCKIMHKGTFKYGKSTEEVTVVINGNNHIEYHENGKYIIRSKLNWLSDCAYDMTMTEITIPNFPFKVGDVMNVKINKIDGNVIYFTSTVKGTSWDGNFVKVKD